MTLTFFFSDIEDSSGLLAEVANAFSAILTDARELQRRVIRAAGGREVDCRGDELFCVFDEPGPAAAAALDIQRAFAAHTWPPCPAWQIRDARCTSMPT